MLGGCGACRSPVKEPPCRSTTPRPTNPPTRFGIQAQLHTRNPPFLPLSHLPPRQSSTASIRGFVVAGTLNSPDLRCITPLFSTAEVRGVAPRFSVFLVFFWATHAEWPGNPPFCPLPFPPFPPFPPRALALAVKQKNILSACILDCRDPTRKAVLAHRKNLKIQPPSQGNPQKSAQCQNHRSVPERPPTASSP